MTKKNENNTTFGNAFAKAFEKKSDKVLPISKKEPVIVSVTPPPQIAAKPTAIAPPPEKALATPNLFYIASKRSPEEIRKDFHNQSASLSKKKGILEGVRAHYYKLSKAGAREPAKIMQLFEFQNVKEELEKYFKDISRGITPKIPGAAAATTQTVIDKAPKFVQQTRKLFSSRTQFQDDESTGKEIHVVIGLDFGTSCTKVVIGTPYEQERAFLVPFKGIAHISNGYLLPTHINLDQSHYILPKTGENGAFSDLKLKLIKTIVTPDDEHDYGHAVAYLALVFRYVRTWFLEEYKAVFGDKQIAWHTNVGVPSATFENNDLLEVYRKAALTAWLVSIREGDITRKLVHAVSDSLYCDTQLIDQSVTLEVFPEVAAEVAGYARSEHRREGLHLMVDVGAGTLDVCGFHLKRVQGTDHYPLLSSNVQLLGALQLDRCRRNSVITAVEKCHQQIMPDGISPVKNDLDSYFPCIEKVREQMISAQDGFAKECKTQIRAVAWDLRRRMATIDNAWENGLPIFLCGGGSALPLYEGLVNEMSDWLRENTTAAGGARSIPLLKPEKLEGTINGAMFHRFAVAWGLSWPSWEIGKIITNLKPAEVALPTDSGNWWDKPPDNTLDDW